MSEINLKLKSYDELIFEITTLTTDKYLLEQKLEKQKELLDKIKEDLIKSKNIGNELMKIDLGHINYLLDLLEEIE